MSGFELSVRVVMELFIKGIQPNAVAAQLLSRLEVADMTFDKLVNIAEERLKSQHEWYSAARASSSSYAADRTSQPSTHIKNEKKKSPHKHHENNSDRQQPTLAKVEKVEGKICQGCGKPCWSHEHWLECPKPLLQKNGKKPNQSAPVAGQVDKPSANANNHNTRAAAKNNINMCEISKPVEDGAALGLEVILAGVSYKAVVDTGADRSCISRGLADKFN